jgi:hypothetical protein
MMHQPSHSYPSQHHNHTPSLSNSAAEWGSATIELRRVLTIPPDDFLSQSNIKTTTASSHSHNAFAVAHAALQALRDSGDVQFLFIRTILEINQQSFGGIGGGDTINITNNSTSTSPTINAQDEELLFHCITGARHVILTKWNTYTFQFKNVVRDLFMTLGHRTDCYSRTVRMTFYNASASFWKRQWNETPTEGGTMTTLTEQAAVGVPTIQLQQSLVEGIMSQHQILNIPQLAGKDDLFRYLEHGITGSLTDISVLSSCCAFLTVLVGEFAGKTASNYSMPLEFHKQAHSTFERNGFLDKSLDMSMKALSHVVRTLNEIYSSNDRIVSVQETDLASLIVQLSSDLVGWEFGTDAWDSGGFPHNGQKSLISPPPSWRPILVQPDFVKAMFHVHNGVVSHQKNGNMNSFKLAHSLRQLLLLLTSLSGPIFQSMEEKRAYATLVLEGILSIMSSTMTRITTTATDEIVSETTSSELLDTLSMISRLIANYKLSILVEVPLMQSLLEGLANMGKYLLHENFKECQVAEGDLDSMQNREFREEALALLLEGIVILCGDPWLLYSGSAESRQSAKEALASTLAPLYTEFVTCRTRMARLEETYSAAHEAELDEVREEIYAVDLEDEMASLAIVGRFDLQTSLACLSSLFASLVPQLQSLWVSPLGVVTPMAAGLLEDSRLVTLYIGHLLTDDNSGETPVIPDAITSACQSNQSTSDAVASAVLTLRQFAEFQAMKIAAHPSDPRLSPLLGKSFLWFFSRFAPAYILPVDYSSSTTPSIILHVWSTTEQVQTTIDFLITLCVHYNCYWPQERQLQENVCLLILAMAKRCKKIRLAIVATPSFRRLVTYHCLTCGVRHSAPPQEFISTVKAKAGYLDIDIDMIRGYHRLNYDVRAKLLTAILVACSEDDEISKSLLNDCIRSIQEAYSSLLNVLS